MPQPVLVILSHQFEWGTKPVVHNSMLLSMAHYWASNSQSSSEKPRRVLGWHPRYEQVLTEIAHRRA